MREPGDELKPYHDVVIVGTGLVESILAAALTKVGKTVLHFEKSEYYGNDEWSSFDLESMLEWAASHAGPLPDSSWDVDTTEVIPTPDALKRLWPKELWGGALLGRQGREEGQQQQEEEAGGAQEDGEGKKEPPPLDPEAPEQCLSVPVLAKAYSSVRVLRYHGTYAAIGEEAGDSGGQAAGQEEGEQQKKPSQPASSQPASSEEQGSEAGGAEDGQAAPPPPPSPFSLIREQSRRFAFDISPTVLLAAGETVEALCSSGVANYMEFKSFEGLYVAGSSSAPPDQEGGALAVHKVPCSKADVFTSKLLSAKDKRQLMKMLQFVTDWGYKRTGKAPVTLRNETELGQGRSLQRPQNKGVVNLDAEGFADRPFGEFLQHAKLDPHARWVVTYALALADEEQEARPLTTEEGLMQLFRHLNGLGRYGETAFLWPVYGANDFIHAFCRTAAVWGATTVLRESVSKLLLDPESGRCRGVVDETGAGLSCDAVILGQDFLHNCSRTGRSLVKRISVLDGPLLGAEGERRVGGLLPPGTVMGNRHSIYFYQLDGDSMVVPQGLYLLYVVAMLDEGEDRGVTDQAFASLLHHSPGVAELWGVTVEAHVMDPPQRLVPSHPFPSNVLFVPRCRAEFYLQSPLDQARALFHQLYPDEAFLPSEVPSELAQYIPNTSVEDEDKDLLESAKQLLEAHGRAAQDQPEGQTASPAEEEQTTCDAEAAVSSKVTA